MTKPSEAVREVLAKRWLTSGEIDEDMKCSLPGTIITLVLPAGWAREYAGANWSSPK